MKVKVYYNPSHGVIADTLIESFIDLVGFYTGGRVSSANAKKLAKAIEKNPEIIKDYGAHSQGSLILGNALKILEKEGKGAILKGSKINMNGSPLYMKAMQEFSEKHGIDFSYKVNIATR